jgi:hypothetical protein
MTECDTVSVQGGGSDTSELVINNVSTASSASKGDTVNVDVEITNQVIDGNGETIEADVLVEGSGNQTTTTVVVDPGQSIVETVSLTMSQTGSGIQICASFP